MNTAQAKKVVLVATKDYEKKYDPILLSLIRRKIELFCVVGKGCELWEEIMDELCVGDGSDGLDSVFITTTSHPDETLADVMEFAKNWICETSDVEVIEI